MTDTERIKDLLPCPSCGSEDVTLWPMWTFLSPLCETCGMTIEAACAGEDTNLQIKTWNRRAPTPREKDLEGKVAALTDLVAEKDKGLWDAIQNDIDEGVYDHRERCKEFKCRVCRSILLPPVKDTALILAKVQAEARRPLIESVRCTLAYLESLGDLEDYEPEKQIRDDFRALIAKYQEDKGE